MVILLGIKVLALVFPYKKSHSVTCGKASKASAVAGKLDVLGLTVPVVGWLGSVRAIVGAEGR